MTKGIDLNNPGDLEWNDHDKWQGLDDPPRDGRWFKFKTAVDGVRAIARVLITFQDKYNLHTIEEWITKYAPPEENDTEAYIKAVCDETGYVRNYPIDAHDYRFQRKIVPAIIRHEQGSMPYSDAQIDEALKRAGIVPAQTASPTMAVVKDPKVIAATIGTGLSSASGLISSVSDFWDTVNRHIDPRFIIWGLIACAAGFLIYYIGQKLAARKQGIA